MKVRGQRRVKVILRPIFGSKISIKRLGFVITLLDVVNSVLCLLQLLCALFTIVFCK